MAPKYYDPSKSGADDGSSEANAWQTFQKALDTAVAGDIVLCTSLNGVVEALAASLDVDTNQGTNGNPIIFRGVNASFVDDGSLCEIDGNDVATNILSITLSNGYISFENFDFHNATGTGINNVSADSIEIKNCKIRDNGGAGIDGTAERMKIRNCTITGNANQGILNVQADSDIIDNFIVDNGGYGIQLPSTRVRVINNVIHNNGDHGIFAPSNESHLILGNTIDGNTGNGIDFNAGPSGNYSTILYNRITNNGGYGISLNGGTFVAGRNYTYNNTSGPLDNPSGYYDNSTDVAMAGDGYTNRASDDFSLTESAEGRRIAICNGATGCTTTTYKSIGASIPTDSGGGGGLLTHPGMNGRMNG